MGLDMYLTATKYVGRWNHSKETEKQAYDTITKAIGLEGHVCEGAPSLNVEIMLCYWRKANAIHKWFVDNVQEGTDDCGNYYVSRERLQELRDTCERVLRWEGLANEQLPTTSGFFFGGTDYDEYYRRDLEQTIKIIDDCLLLPDSWDIEYRSSW